VVRMGKFKRMDFATQMQPIVELLVPRANVSGCGFCIDALDETMVGIIAKYTRTPAHLPPDGGVVLVMPNSFKCSTGVSGRPHCVGHREAKYWIVCECTWAVEAQKAAAMEWQANFMKEIRAHCTGGTTAHTFELRGDQGQVYGQTNLAFLKEAKVMYDPTNFWRMNVNIAPASPSKAGSRRTSGTTVGPIPLPTLR